ncbi:xanthine dehydrogenase family protein molybdopterin-binding subunit [Falsiroseomonas sp. HC035]|uniref:xanthine dehydrogenase family protein molybdopterin-binding subunit n=1 Tax=Falsiroseomonas sp. HC035 TaxID=3390999 RepID=UPI003D313C7B
MHSKAEGLPGGGRAPAHRREDHRFITGGGRYSDDFNLPGQAHAAFVRSDHAHGLLRGLDVEAARRAPGVIGVFIGEDLRAAGVGPLQRLPLRNFVLTRDVATPRPGLAQDRVRYVGEPIALVVAESLNAARDAAELITADIEALPAVTDVALAVEPDAPQLWPDASRNTTIQWQSGEPEAIDRAFAEAAHVTRLRLVNSRIFANPIEPRSCITSYDEAADRLEWLTPSQGSEYMLRVLCDQIFHVPDERIHIRTHDVGGAFGVKEQPYPEDIALLHAARALRRPVKWRATRSDNLISDNHARDAVIDCALALDAEGRFLAVRASILAGMGAYFACNGPNASIRNTSYGLPQAYLTPLSHTRVDCVMTNTAPIGPYRGAGREQAAYIVERLVDESARQLGIDRIALRRRNLIPPSAIPYRTPSGRLYDSGEFEAVLDQALVQADWDGFAARRRTSEQAGLIRGQGISCFLENVGGFNHEGSHIRFTEDGRVLLVVATQSQGQSHETTFPQVVAARLGIPYGQVELRQGDSADKPVGFATVGSRSMIMAGSALANTCAIIIEKGRRAAAHLLEAAEADIEFDAGSFRVAGTDRAIPLLDLARLVGKGPGWPEDLPGTLDSTGDYTAPDMHFPNGCHICEVEIDPSTGRISVERYVAVDDVGTMINPRIVHGQVQGGVAQGLGQVLMEHCQYNEDGQFLTGSLMDYALPRASDLPAIGTDFHPVPSPKNPLGVKGAGECGVTGSLPALMNAVADALSSVGASPLIDMPVTAEKVWRALDAVRQPG